MALSIGFDIYRQLWLAGPTKLNSSYVRWDGLIQHAAAPGRGVFLKFINFKGDALGYTTNIYFRAVYVLYPQPALVAQPDVVVNNAPQLMAGNSYPDEQWLIDRGVGSIMFIDFDQNRQQPFVRGVKWLSQ
jgi:hypothetical protein